MLAIYQKLLDAKATDETKAVAPASLRKLGIKRLVHIIEWSTGVTAGEVVVEAASSPDYTGTWAVLATVTYASGAPHAVAVTTDGPYPAIRHRINEAVVNGTVTSYISGAE